MTEPSADSGMVILLAGTWPRAGDPPIVLRRGQGTDGMGVLVDGAHRLAAVAEAGRCVTVRIAWLPSVHP